jgi:hypothetical protein
MLQYWSQPEVLVKLVESYARCSRGFSPGPDAPPNEVPLELLVTADQPAEAGEWARQWRKWQRNSAPGYSGKEKTEEEGDEAGILLVLFSHNVHENRGYNTLARAASGSLLVLAQVLAPGGFVVE